MDIATNPTDPVQLEAPSPETKRYNRQKLQAGLASMALSLAALLAMALVGGVPLDAWVRAHVGANAWVRLIVLGFIYAAGLELVSLPLDFWSSYVLEHRYQLSNMTFGGWVVKHLKGYLLAGPLGLVLLLGLYSLIWFTGSWWWVLATIATLMLMLVLGRILPVVILPLFYKVTRLDEPDLLARLQRLADGTGLTVEGIYRLGLSAETKKANAALAGLGRSRRVLLGDTLLNEFTPEEIEVVFAHEVGHHVHRHLVKLVIWSVVTSAVGFWLIDVLLHRLSSALGYPRFDDPSALPLLILIPMLFGMAIGPIQNALSRLFERQSDRYALERTRMPEAYRSAFLKLARMNKADPDPHPLLVWLFDDHPPIRERLRLADLPLPPPPMLTQA
jgi:STE24 endopeptidase